MGAPGLGASGQRNEERQKFGMKMKARMSADWQRDTAHYDDVTLADGTVIAVARGNLAAAAQRQREAQPARRHLQPVRQDQAIYRVATPVAVTETSQRASTPASDGRAVDGDVHRIALPVALPCALGDCGQPARTALIEPDPGVAGRWNLLPVCEDGERHAQPHSL